IIDSLQWNRAVANLQMRNNIQAFQGFLELTMKHPLGIPEEAQRGIHHMLIAVLQSTQPVLESLVQIERKGSELIHRVADDLEATDQRIVEAREGIATTLQPLQTFATRLEQLMEGLKVLAPRLQRMMETLEVLAGKANHLADLLIVILELTLRVIA